MNKGYTIDILPHGYVRYIDHLGTDQRIVEAARVSYGAFSKGEEADKKLLEYLFRNRHTSPFEQCNITFNIRMPIFVMRQFVRHRTFRLNEYSGRYSKMTDDFFFPELLQWRTQDQKNKQGSITSEKLNESTVLYTGKEMNLTSAVLCHYSISHDLYTRLLMAGVSKEQARMVLPVSNYTEIYVNCDLHNLLHFFRLRTDEHAQKEIRDVALAMLNITKNLFPWTMECYHKWKMVMVEEKE